MLPPKYAFLEPYNWKKKGRPTEKRVAKLLNVEDDPPFVDRAAPNVTCLCLAACHSIRIR